MTDEERVDVGSKEDVDDKVDVGLNIELKRLEAPPIMLGRNPLSVVVLVVLGGGMVCDVLVEDGGAVERLMKGIFQGE